MRNNKRLVGLYRKNMKYRILISKGIAGKILQTDDIEDFSKSKFGRYWFYWLPSINRNGGKFSKNQVVDVDIIWLCFWFGLMFCPTSNK